MKIDIQSHCVQCPRCRTEDYILLPRQSPLGVFLGLESQPSNEWPAEFLCTRCVQPFVCSDREILDGIPVLAQFAETSYLVRIEYEYGPPHFSTPKALYMSYSQYWPQIGAIGPIVEKAKRFLESRHDDLRIGKIQPWKCR